MLMIPLMLGGFCTSVLGGSTYRFLVTLSTAAKVDADGPQARNFRILSSLPGLRSVALMRWEETLTAVYLDTTSLTASDLPRVRRFLRRRPAEKAGRRIYLLGENGCVAVNAPPADLPARLPSGSQNERLPLFLSTLDRFADSISGLSDENPYLQVALLTRDRRLRSGTVPFTDLDLTPPLRVMRNRLIEVIANRGVSLEIVDFGNQRGLLGQWAEEFGGVRVEPDSPQPEGAAGGTPQKYLLLAEFTGGTTGEWTPEPIPLEIRDSGPTLRSPRSFWPLPEGIRAPGFRQWSSANRERSEVQRLLSLDDPLAALVRARRLVEDSPLSLEDRLLLIESLEALDAVDPGELRRTIAQAATLFPNAPALLRREARYALQESDPERALGLYARALEVEPADLDSFLGLARIEESRGHWARSRTLLEEALEQVPQSVAARLELSFVLERTGDRERALTLAEESIALEPDSPEPLWRAATLLLDFGDYARALVVAHRLLDLSRPDLRGHFVSGVALAFLGRADEAGAELEQADQGFHQDSRFHWALARCRVQSGDPAAAIAEYRRALELEKKEPALYSELAKLHLIGRDVMAAGRVLRAGQRECPTSTSLAGVYAEWLTRRARWNQAAAMLRRVGGENPEPAESDRVRAHIRELELLSSDEEMSPANEIETAAGESSAETRLMVPGGLQPILRFVPAIENRIESEDLLELLFRYLLSEEPMRFPDAMPSIDTNPLRDEAGDFYAEFLEFRKWLRKEHLFEPQLTLRLTGGKSDLKRINKIFSFFGVKVRSKRRGRTTELETKLDDRPSHLRRRTVLKWWGINPLLLTLGDSITLDLRDAPVALGPGLNFWRRVIGVSANSPETVLVRWLDSPDAMRLYVALRSIPESAARYLVKQMTPGDLVEKAAPAILSLGVMLEFDEDGAPRFPGLPTTQRFWEGLLGASLNDPHRLLPQLFGGDDGKVIALLAAVSHLPPAAQGYFLELGRLPQLYRSVTRPGDYFGAGRPARSNHDLADFLRLARTDGGRLLLPGPATIWFAADEAMELGVDEVPDEAGRIWLACRNQAKLLDWLLAGDRATTNCRKYAMLVRLGESHADLLSAGLGTLVRKSFLEKAPILEALANLQLEGDAAVGFLLYLEHLKEQASLGDRWTAMGMVQGTLVVAGKLVQKGRVPSEVSTSLAMKFLERLHESAAGTPLAESVADFLVEDLGPYLPESPAPSAPSYSDRLLRALLDSRLEKSFVWGEHEYAIPPSRRFVAANHFLRDQEMVSMDRVLESIRRASRLGTGQAEGLRSLKAAVAPLLLPRLERPSYSGAYREAIEHVQIGLLRRAMSNLQDTVSRGIPKEVELREEAGELIEQLSPYLAESLIGIVYALGAGGDNVLLSSDPDLVRKHSFGELSIPFGYRRPEAPGGPWGRPVLKRDPVLGSRIIGSLIGVGEWLDEIAADQFPAEPATRVTDTAFAAAQVRAISLVREEELSGETIDAVGELLDCGRVVLARSHRDAVLRKVVLEHLSRRVGARRWFRLKRALEAGESPGIARELLPSELLGLGFSQKGLGEVGLCDADRLAPISKEELDNFGRPDASWFGFDDLRIFATEPPEALTTYSSAFRLAERVCEVKLLVAEQFYRLGLPAALFKDTADRVTARVYAGIHQVSRTDWRGVTEAFRRVDEKLVLEMVQREIPDLSVEGLDDDDPVD